MKRLIIASILACVSVTAYGQTFKKGVNAVYIETRTPSPGHIERLSFDITDNRGRYQHVIASEQNPFFLSAWITQAYYWQLDNKFRGAKWIRVRTTTSTQNGVTRSASHVFRPRNNSDELVVGILQHKNYHVSVRRQRYLNRITGNPLTQTPPGSSFVSGPNLVHQNPNYPVLPGDTP